MTVAGRGVALTATEYEILRILSVHAGRVVTSEPLLRQAWGDRQPTDTERVRAFVKQIRPLHGLAVGEVPPGEGHPVHPVGLAVEQQLLGYDTGPVVDLDSSERQSASRSS